MIFKSSVRINEIKLIVQPRVRLTYQIIARYFSHLHNGLVVRQVQLDAHVLSFHMPNIDDNYRM